MHAPLTDLSCECLITHMPVATGGAAGRRDQELARTENGRTTADVRRETIAGAALRVFGKTGYHATPVADIAAASGYSQAYVFRLFSDKLTLFVAALDLCFARIGQTIDAGAGRAADRTPGAILEAMGDAYAELIADRDLLMLQVHAQSASDIPEIRDAMRRGLVGVVAIAGERSGGDQVAIQQFIAYGQLCHLIVTAGLDGVDASWARMLTNGMTHVDAPAEVPSSR